MTAPIVTQLSRRDMPRDEFFDDYLLGIMQILGRRRRSLVGGQLWERIAEGKTR